MAVENRKRHSMFQHISANGLREDDIILITDVDEIPRCETMQLLRWCDGLPDVLNLVSCSLLSFSSLFGRPQVHALAVSVHPHGDVSWCDCFIGAPGLCLLI